MVNPFSNLKDEELMEYYKQGEFKAFEVLYLRHKNKVYSYFKKRVPDREAVEDLFQSVFTKFHKSRLKYNKEFPLLKWIYTICKSEWLDANKKKKLLMTDLKEEHFMTQDDFHREAIILENEKSLTGKEKAALRLRYYFDEDFLAISKKLHTLESGARKLISRGLKKLKLKYLRSKNHLRGENDES